MEAMILGYPPEQAGQISVTATHEEWRSILHDMHEPGDTWPPEALDLIAQLKKFGVEY